MVYSAPPPSAGGTVLCEMLQVLAGWDLGLLGYRTPQTIHLMAETMRHAYIDRNTAFGDPDFVARPGSAPAVARIRRRDPRRRSITGRATPSAALGPGTPPHEAAETTHYSVVDIDGNAVAVTYTLNGNFGAAVVAPGTGFLLNNEMDDFTVKPGAPNLFGLVQGKANAIAPGKRPLSSMTPTIVERDGALVARARQSGRAADHHLGARNDHQHRRFRPVAARRGRGAAVSPAMAARPAVLRARRLSAGNPDGAGRARVRT